MEATRLKFVVLIPVVTPDTKPFTIVTFGIVESITGLPDATTDTNYNYVLTPTGGTAPYSFALASGALPNDLSFSSFGVISGVSQRRRYFHDSGHNH